jgi:hypothetical protein
VCDVVPGGAQGTPAVEKPRRLTRAEARAVFVGRSVRFAGQTKGRQGRGCDPAGESDQAARGGPEKAALKNIRDGRGRQVPY